MSRVDRVTEAVRREVSTIIHDELKDPRLGFVTITRVEMSKDLRNAKVFFSVLGKEEDHAKTQEAIDSALGFIRRLVAERINLRFAPEIIFREDRSSEYSVRIQELLDEVKKLQVKEAQLEKKVSEVKRESDRLHKGRARAKTRKEGSGGPKRSSRSRKKI